MISNRMNGTGAESSFQVWCHSFSILPCLFTDAVLRVMNGESAFSHFRYNCLWGNCCINDLQMRGLRTLHQDSCRGGGIPLVSLYLHAV